MKPQTLYEWAARHKNSKRFEACVSPGGIRGYPHVAIQLRRRHSTKHKRWRISHTIDEYVTSHRFATIQRTMLAISIRRLRRVEQAYLRANIGDRLMKRMELYREGWLP